MLYNRRACCMMPQPMMGPMPAAGAGACGCGCGMECGSCGCDPIIEQPIEKCVRREFCHEVPHVCPVHTTVVNNHVYRHTYTPQFTCSEENVVTNVGLGSCCNFQ